MPKFFSDSTPSLAQWTVVNDTISYPILWNLGQLWPNPNLSPNLYYKSKPIPKPILQIQTQIQTLHTSPNPNPNPKGLMPNPNLSQDLLHPYSLWQYIMRRRSELQVRVFLDSKKKTLKLYRIPSLVGPTALQHLSSGPNGNETLNPDATRVDRKIKLWIGTRTR
jgi:hypothetical protein